MNEQLFSQTVALLQTICKKTSLTYEEINILLYCLFLPGTWLLLAWLRKPKFHWLWLVHLGLPLWFWLRRRELTGFSKKFYDENTLALLKIGGGTEAGYVEVSVIVGIAVPLAVWLALLFLPRNWVWRIYWISILSNLAWYVFALARNIFAQ